MARSSVVLFQGDLEVTQTLVVSLASPFYSINIVRSLEELRTSIVNLHPYVVVFDMELASVKDLSTLCREYPEVRFVCNHRLADEEMWTTALNAGAADVCPSSDPKAIVSAAVPEAKSMHALAA